MRGNTDLSQHEKALKIMIQHKDKTKWFYAWEFINNDGVFMGHRGPARISELAIRYPEMIESKKEGKFKLFRFRFENIDEFIEKIPEDLKWFVRTELAYNGSSVLSEAREPLVFT